jgi:hypothetical protein
MKALQIERIPQWNWKKFKRQVPWFQLYEIRNISESAYKLAVWLQAVYKYGKQESPKNKCKPCVRNKKYTEYVSTLEKLYPNDE